MLFIVTQQVQPDFIMAVMQAQQAWIIAPQAGSPLVHVMQTPSSVGSHLQSPMVMLNPQTIIPFIMQQQLHRPPAIMVQRFWSMPAETLSSQAQTIFMPPLHFSKVIVQRGTIIMFVPAGAVAGVPIIPPAPAMVTPGMPIPGRSIIIAVVILSSFLKYRVLVGSSPLAGTRIVLSPATSFKAYHQKIYEKRIVTKLIMIGMLVMIDRWRIGAHE